MSNAPPARIASFDTVATTSPVECCARTAGPDRAAWWPTTWANRNDACSQLETAARWRITPAAACTAPRPSRMPDQTTSARESSSTIPSSIARPIANGISACATIHTTPNTIPRTSVPTWCRPDPDEQARRGARVRLSRVVHRQPDHGSILATGVGRAQVVSTVIDQTMSASGRVA